LAPSPPPSSPIDSVADALVAEQLASEHEAHRRRVVEALGWVLSVFPLATALGGVGVVGARQLVPLFGLGLSSLLGVWWCRRGRVGAAFGLIVAAGAAVAFDAHALQQVSQLSLVYLPLLILVAATAFRRGVAVAAAVVLMVVSAVARFVVFEGMDMEWFSLTLDVLAILGMAAVLVFVDRGRVERDRALLRTALIDVEQRRQSEAEMGRQLERIARAANAANEAKTRFLLRVSHELRTPLNAILGYAELLAEDEEFPELFRTDLSHIDHAGRALLRLVEDVLDISRIESGQLELQLEEVSLVALVQPVVEAMCPLLAQRHNRLILDASQERVTLDVARTRQILRNLLSNAARFTTEGTVTVRAARSPEQVVLTVEDTGIGIRRDRLAHLFHPFVKEVTDGQGAGLGLALVDRLARGMGGHVEVDSEVGRGSQFRVLLPIAALQRG
jgi:signal transduction histidine kinase